MKGFVEFQNVRLSEREELMGSAFKNSSFKKLEMQEKLHLSENIPLTKDHLLL